MSACHHACYVAYFVAFIGLLYLYQYAYDLRRNFLPVSISDITQSSTPQLNTEQLPTNNLLLLEHIEQCPECVLFLFNRTHAPQETSQLYDVLNSIPVRTQAIFYPLTMKLIYNQPIPFYSILSSNPVETVRQVRLRWSDHLRRLKGLRVDSILGFIQQSLERPMEATNHTWPNQTKLILYYTKFFGNSYWYNADAKSVYANDLHPEHCPISANTCYVTADSKLFSASDASLVHIRESVDYTRLAALPRRSDQRLVFFLKESPVHSPTLSSKQHGHLFNYTQTYRPDSDITATTLRDFFWLFNHKIFPNYDFQSIIDRKKPGKRLVAIVSNCGGSSNRLTYIKELKRYTSVDVYGRCGKECPKSVDCRQYAYDEYKFYLAFENSLCEEYVTEKFFYALHSARIVPVVLGWAHYEAYMPSSGYIDVREYASPRELAAYIDYLDRNTSAYLEYFHWRQYALPIKLPKYICELCLKLFLDDRNHREQTLEHIDQYWNRDRQCHAYSKNKHGKWMMT